MKKFAIILLIVISSCSTVRDEAKSNQNKALMSPVRCTAITLKGAQCKRTTYDIDSLCWQHKKK
ncbi:MAG: hypothetical protein KIT33_15660 [Candidatus Kapabacteria bacterium]|nr:hypothetical protein [Ignavibacteriota bacterium]MCW5886407.1 hypothetical protein [Candidatus Kapabacteria bacterium]